MKARNYILPLLLIISLVATTSCMHEARGGPAKKPKPSRTEIKIDVTSDEKYIISAIWEFNKNSAVNKINYDTVICDEEYKIKDIAKLLAGEAPDIIRVEPWLFSAVRKVADSGMFYDLDNLINEDKSFKLADYNQKAMAGGVINNKRVFIPIQYDFPVFYAKNNALKDNGITAEGPKWTLGNLAEKASEFSQKNKGKIFMLSGNFNLSYIVKSSGLDFIDYKKKQAKFNSAEFIDLLNIYKKLYPTVKAGDSVIGYMSVNEGEVLNWDVSCPEFESGSALLMDSSFVQGWYKCLMNRKHKVYLLPQYTSKKSILIEPKLSFAINSKSAHKDEAFEFIKLLLSEEYQMGKKERILINIPVNNNAFLNTADFLLSNFGDNAEAAKNEADIEKRKLQIKEQIKEIESISRCDMTDGQVYKIINDEAKAFTDGRKNANQTAQIIQDKVMLYLNE